MAKQPTAIAFARSQEAYARWMRKRAGEELKQLESLERPLTPEERYRWSELEEDWDFFDRYAEAMRDQREYLHEKFKV